jgi:hypothetical protein
VKRGIRDMHVMVLGISQSCQYRRTKDCIILSAKVKLHFRVHNETVCRFDSKQNLVKILTVSARVISAPVYFAHPNF